MAVINVLIIDDSEDDALLIVRKLKNEGYTVSYKRVDTAAAMRAELECGVWDCIICDYNMPSFSAPEALNILKDHGKDIPFIVVSGVIGEETAVAMMKAGAHDYIRKDALARMIPAIEREVKDAGVRSERKKAEEALKKSEAFIRNILESVDEGFIVVDKDFRLISANKAFCKLVGVEESEAIGKHCHELAHQSDKPCFESGEDCPVRHTFMTGEHYTVTHLHHGKNGLNYYLEIKSYPIKDLSGQVLSVIETLNDITEKRRLEEQLRHAQKLEALGTLAGGVAHDFNNILTAISGYSGLIKMNMREDDPNSPYIKEVLAASDRAAHLTQALLLFSRKQTTELKPLNVNKLVGGMKKMMLRLIGEDIETSVVLSPEDLVIMGDAGQMEQVLMNFVTNARDAMPNGGSLLISVQKLEMDDEFVHFHGFGKHGKYALISVSDTGCGMDEKTRERIFEPFFTTKGMGRGTGLGLSIVFGIVKQHNGHINCYSELGKGTTFKVYLPLIDEKLIETEDNESVVLKGGNETILVADDEASIRSLIKELLEKYGYTVIDAQDDMDAVEKFLINKDRIDLILLDVVMPKKGGKEAYDEIKGINPKMKTIFMSGYAEDMIQRQKIMQDRLPLLQKPLQPKNILAKIRETLDRPSE